MAYLNKSWSTSLELGVVEAASKLHEELDRTLAEEDRYIFKFVHHRAAPLQFRGLTKAIVFPKTGCGNKSDCGGWPAKICRKRMHCSIVLRPWSGRKSTKFRWSEYVSFDFNLKILTNYINIYNILQIFLGLSSVDQEAKVLGKMCRDQKADDDRYENESAKEWAIIGAKENV